MSFAGAETIESSSSEPTESFRPNFRFPTKPDSESLRVQSTDFAISKSSVLKPFLFPGGIAKMNGLNCYL